MWWPADRSHPSQPLPSRSEQYDDSEPTIYALSTAVGRAAIAVIRISGVDCDQIYDKLCPNTRFPGPRKAALRTLYEPSQPPSVETVLDKALVICFWAPKTATGEDLMELHVHGGPAIVKAVLAAIPKCGSNIRYAEPGEFTRRAFLNGRMDLTQVEALGDTLSAETEQQRKLSVRGTSSGLAKRYDDWRQQLLYARGELEALIDFSEDQHFDESPAQLASSVAAQVLRLQTQIEAHSTNAVRGELLRNGISIALLGEPNAGKSSLMNTLVGREAAIVSQEAGTTRDIIETGLDLSGWFCRIGDTAGLRNNLVVDATGATKVGAIEQEGMKRAKQRALDSDVVIVVYCIEALPYSGAPTLSLSPEVTATARECIDRGKKVIVVVNKDDIIQGFDEISLKTQWSLQIQNALSIHSSRIHFISCHEAGRALGPDPGRIRSFLDGMVAVFKEMTAAFVPDYEDGDVAPDPSIWQESLGATERQRLLLESCSAHLDEFLANAGAGGFSGGIELEGVPDADVDIVLAAESLRAAADCLAKITGKGEAGDVEEVLGVVFEKFCVGK
ncbi:P-loop containing nucleoside triphosphate hydrolase protein [Saccharata proteae CBS 121410]|uniref:P-loop containing nucleoside triphosphate hydrolase protein n=1 Tax=Saccharata proteae CBS 121410 TaxID=1314787 RepID=A0A9P4LW39_9PEZI|nr:P-loop containing nucleoside triphosphate hydrolase protein [Saccharata proteae CBS 121410]